MRQTARGNATINLIDGGTQDFAFSLSIQLDVSTAPVTRVASFLKGLGAKLSLLLIVRARSAAAPYL